MPSIRTIKDTIKRTNKQLKRQKNKQAYSKELKQKLDAKDETERLERKLLLLTQELTLAEVKLNVQRDKEIKGTERVHNAI